MGLFENLFHPKRPAERAAKKSRDDADNARKALDAEAEKNRAAQEKLKQDKLDKIHIKSAECKTEVNTTYTENLDIISKDLEKAKANDRDASYELERFFSINSQEISRDYQKKFAAIEKAKAKDMELLHNSFHLLKKRSKQAEDCYGKKISNVKVFWDQVRNDMLHQQCSIIYNDIKTGDNQAKPDYRNLSLLTSYFKYLCDQSIIEIDERNRYAKFIYDLISNNDIKVDKQFLEVDNKLTAIFSRMQGYEESEAKEAYESDLDDEFLDFYAKCKEQVLQQHADQIIKLNESRLVNEQKRDSTYQDIFLQLENNRSASERIFDDQFQSLGNYRTDSLEKISTWQLEQEQPAIDSFNEKSKEIDNSLKKAKDDVDAALNERLKVIKNSHKYLMINVGVAIGGIAASIVTFGASAAAAAGSMAELLYGSLALSAAGSGLGALGNIINGKAEEDFSISGQLHIPLSPAPTPKYNAKTPEHKQENTVDPQPVNLNALRERLSKVTESVRADQAIIEDNLFYAIGRTPSSTPSSQAITFPQMQRNQSNQIYSGLDDMFKIKINFGDSESTTIFATADAISNFINSDRKNHMINILLSAQEIVHNRDNLIRDVKGDPNYIPESSMATIAAVGTYTVIKNFVTDTVGFVGSVIDAHNDAWKMQYTTGNVQEAAATRIKARINSTTTAIKSVVSNPGIIGEALEKRFKDNATKWDKAYNLGDLIGAGVATGDTVYDVYIITAATMYGGVRSFKIPAEVIGTATKVKDFAIMGSTKYKATYKIADALNAPLSQVSNMPLLFNNLERHGRLDMAAEYSGGKAVKSGYFNSKADPLLKSMGDAKISHPEEYALILHDLKKNGVEVVIREGDAMAFSPNMSGGAKGCRIILPEEFSISALRHEYGHFLDHKALGHPNFGKYINQPELRVATERRQYLQELRFAKEYGDTQSRKILTENYLSEREYIVSNFYEREYGKMANTSNFKPKGGD